MSFELGEWTVRPESGQISHATSTQRIQPRLMRLLTYLAEHPGEVISKQRLNEAVWDGAHVTDDALTHSICQLRRVLGDTGEQPRFILTIPKRGYQFIGPIKSVACDSHPLAELRRLAVLPLTHQPEAAIMDPLTASILTDKLIVGLVRCRCFRVVSRTSVLKRIDMPVQDLSRELGVDVILEGTIAMTGGAARLALGLLNGENEHLWAGVYQFDPGEIMTAELGIVDAIVRDLSLFCTADPAGAEPG